LLVIGCFLDAGKHEEGLEKAWLDQKRVKLQEGLHMKPSSSRYFRERAAPGNAPVGNIGYETIPWSRYHFREVVGHARILNI
jgi:hypothetical protein